MPLLAGYVKNKKPSRLGEGFETNLQKRLEERAGRSAGHDAGIERATTEDNRNNVGGSNRAISAGDLVLVPAEVAVLITVVVQDVVPLKFARSELRGELEGTFARVALWDETLERVFTDQERDLKWSRNPSRINPRGGALGGSNADKRFDRGQHAGRKRRATDWALVDTERNAPVGAFPAVAQEGVLADIERAGGDVAQVGHDVKLGAERLDNVGAADEFVIHRVAVAEHWGQIDLGDVAGELVQRLERELTDRVRRDVGKANVDLGLAAREAGLKAVGAAVGGNVLDAGAGEQGGAHVAVEVLSHQFLQRVFGHEVRALVGRVRALDADLWTATALGAERVGVLGRCDAFARGGSSGAQVSGSDEGRGDERVGREGLLLNDRTNRVGNTGGQHAAVKDVYERGVNGESFGDLTEESVSVFARDRRGHVGRDNAVRDLI